MTRAWLFALLIALTGCGVPDRQDDAPGRSDTRQVPSNYEPGLHITGHASVGVVRSF